MRSSLSSSRIGRGAGLAAVLGVAVASGCGKPAELDGQDLCDEVGYAIANRTFQCQNDPDLGNQRFEDLRASYHCQTATAVAQGQTGSICAVSALGCDAVAANGSDLDWWLVASGCGTWFTRADGTALPPLLDGGTVGPTCTGSTVLCHDVCIDVDSDTANCGACGARCPSATTCIDRVCEFR